MQKKPRPISRRPSPEAQALMSAIQETQEKIAQTYRRFNHTTDEAIIDCCIYEMSALNQQYSYFLRIAKEMGLVMNGYARTS